MPLGIDQDHYEIVMVMSYLLCSSMTAAEHVYSYASKYEGDRQWRHLHTWWRRRVTYLFWVAFTFAACMAVFLPVGPATAGENRSATPTPSSHGTGSNAMTNLNSPGTT